MKNQMKQSSLTTLLVILIILFTHNSANAFLWGYDEFSVEDSVKTEFKWQRSNFMNKNSDAILNLKVTNLNEKAVEFIYSIGFYEDDLLVFESDQDTLCIDPGKNKRGGLHGLRFTVDDLNKEKATSKNFSWEYTAFIVKETEICPE